MLDIYLLIPKKDKVDLDAARSFVKAALVKAKPELSPSSVHVTVRAHDRNEGPAECGASQGRRIEGDDLAELEELAVAAYGRFAMGYRK
jgi:hypothetical protein